MLITRQPPKLDVSAIHIKIRIDTMDSLENITFDEIKIGDSCVYTKTLSESDLILFAAVSGDVNPVHLNEEFASESMFKERIAHGMWSGSLVSATLATVMPGPGTIYLNQSLNFKRPVKIGDKLEVNLEAIEKNEDRKTVSFFCRVINQDGKEVLNGTATVIAPIVKIKIDKPVLPQILIQNESPVSLPTTL